jgi:hypothetical protein
MFNKIAIKIGSDSFFPRHFSYPGKNASVFGYKMLAKKRSIFPWVGKNA